MAARRLTSDDPEPYIGSVVFAPDGHAYQRSLNGAWQYPGAHERLTWAEVAGYGAVELLREVIPEVWSEGDSAPPEGTIIATPGYLPRMWVEGRWMMDGLTATVPQNCRPLHVLRWGWGYDG